ncbi:importin subunit alpha-2 [Pyrus ussuriensis x Pyrus communis]|uniref:Importin subunit alpha-2 n=1 Tax=Pyrus ussuriensis x Pyrus communis TaxID=2448454 RepID=A0A5N5FXL6_9ROSA|nr:importin subunit alpha-2 [Pyrus ussuriensis x Pyrus communis]
MLSKRLDIHARNPIEGLQRWRFDTATRDHNMRLSARIVSVISGFRLYKVVLIEARIIALLIRVLECGSEVGEKEAGKSL